MARQSRQVGRHSSRQARRAQERRAQTQHRRQPAINLPGGQVLAGVAVVVAAIALFGFFALKGTGNGSSSPTASAFKEGPAVAMVHCDQGMSVSNIYHVHAHLVILRNGKRETVSANAGHYFDKDCLYWTHAHDTTGVIHVEAPNKIVPTLGTWFRVLDRTTPGQVPDITPSPGETRKVWINQQPFYGNPLAIELLRHVDIWIEIGPPFVTPKPFHWGIL